MSAVTEPSRPRELLIELDRSSAASLRHQLESNIRAGIRAGRLGPGTCLPSTRALAIQLGVSRGVVVDAYDQLATEGLLTTRKRRPPLVLAPRPPVRRTTEPQAPRFRCDLTPGIPDLSLFPRVEWCRAISDAARVMPAGALGYPDPCGEWVLREELAEYLCRTRGVAAHADDILITQGYTQALRLVCEALRRNGAGRIGVEDPSFDRQWDIVRSAGLTVVPIPVDADGLRVDALARAGVRAAIVTPAHQFPTGVTLSPARRTALIEWARSNDALVIEDDYDAEFRYDRSPLSALQGAACDHVAFVGTASKMLAPALRLAWLIAPRQLRDAVVSAKTCMDAGSPVLEQHALATMLSHGLIDRHVRTARNSYRHRRDTFLADLTTQLPGATVSGVSAGLFVTLTFADPLDEPTLVAEAARSGLAVIPLGAFRLRDLGPPGLVLGYGTVSASSSACIVTLLRHAVHRAQAPGALRTATVG
ncbi:MAG TPA: PLP-dependent aminotransferase family protein [Pseudonocardiaceae bacterium]|nr:PLP-dependent aminotransferase family protein [Pseudonocardiaceae bacterium]